MKRVALIGSSGGGTATLGHTDPLSFFQTVDEQLSLIDGQAKLDAALFVSLEGGKGMDGIDEHHPAQLVQIEQDGPDAFRHGVVATGPLRDVNATCALRQRRIAKEIQEGRVDALICVSCHVGIFRETLMEASLRSIPVTGSGGTSLANIGSLFNIDLVGNAGGSVATTSLTKAVSYSHALAVAWGQAYRPWKSIDSERPHENPSWISVLNSCLPAFWAVCLTKRILLMVKNMTDTGLAGMEETVAALERHTLPTVCAVIMAMSLRRKSAVTSESLLVMSATVASSSCTGSILTALWAGYLVVKWSDRILYACIFLNIPATMMSLIIGGGLGGAVSLLLLPVVGLLRALTALLRLWLITLLRVKPWGAVMAFGLGCWSCYGSKVGWYHSVHLPLILIEMELGDAGVLGAVDELSLVLVCGGICAAKLVQFHFGGPLSSSDRLLCRRGLRINLTCGDFVEVCYPFMDSSWLINLSGYIASGVSCSWLVWRGRLVSGMAYLPWPVVVAIASEQYQAMLEASALAFGLSFLLTLFALVSPNHASKNSE